jgi:hypothetical protein
LQDGAFEIDHVAVFRALESERDHVDSEQRLERGVIIVPLRRDLDVDSVALVDVGSDEGKTGIAATQFACL